MTPQTFLFSTLVATHACACSTTVKGQDDSSTDEMAPEQECPAGTADCACAEDDSCFGGLVCSVGLCVQVELGADPLGAGGATTQDLPCDGNTQGVHVVGQNTGQCYRFVDTRAPWSTAREDCQDWGGDLVTVRSRQQQAELTALFESETDDNSAEIWLGLRSGDGVWEWVSQEPLRYTSWATTEPDQQSESECGYFFARSGYDWHDQDCSNAYFFVCER